MNAGMNNGSAAPVADLVDMLAGLPCVYCGAAATDYDHLSGRPAGREPYCDPDLKLPSCHGCNVLGYQAWEANGLTVVADLFITRARRVALSSLRVAESGLIVPVPPRIWVANARLITDLADELQRRAT